VLVIKFVDDRGWRVRRRIRLLRSIDRRILDQRSLDRR
jgi:hypothetical protein